MKTPDEFVQDMITIDPETYGTTLFYPSGLDDEKQWTKFIKAVESVTRRSVELKDYIKYLKEELDLDNCHFFKNMSIENGIDIELHHSPFTMYDICSIVARKRIRLNESVTTFMVANEVVEAHYKNIIGLVPLSKTVHELVHSGKVFVPPTLVFGDITKFLKLYAKDISIDMLDKLKSILTITPDEANKINRILNVNMKVNDYQLDDGELKTFLLTK